MTELVEKLKDLNAKMAPAPWSVAGLYCGIRHVQRNSDAMEDGRDNADDPADRKANLPDRYDGEPLAKLRNLLPEIIAALGG